MKDKTVECIDACCEDEVLIVYQDNDGKIKMAPGTLDPGEGFAYFRDDSVIWHGDIIALGDDQSLRVFATLLKSDSTIGGGSRRIERHLTEQEKKKKRQLLESDLKDSRDPRVLKKYPHLGDPALIAELEAKLKALEEMI